MTAAQLGRRPGAAVSVFVDACGTNQDAQRVDVARTSRRVTISVFDEDPVGAEICPELARRVDLTVDLGGRLGRRAIIDGSDGRTVVGPEVAVPWRFEDRTFQAGQRRVKISFPRLCGPTVQGYTRFAVRRGKRSITVRVLQAPPRPARLPDSVWARDQEGLAQRTARPARRPRRRRLGDWRPRPARQTAGLVAHATGEGGSAGACARCLQPG